MRNVIAILLIANFFCLSLYGQDALETGGLDKKVSLKRVEGTIKIDGKLDEEAWYLGQAAREFWENFPSDSTLCEWETEIYMAYDDNFLYVGAKCYAPGTDYIVPSLRRDYRAGGSDNLTFLFDPFRDRTNAFVFGMNPYGVMREALIFNGGNSSDDWLGEWDNKWNGASAIFDDYWSCEIAIPFSTIRFPEGERFWYFNSYRFDTQSNTRSTWQQIPQNQIIMSLAYMGNMEWEEPPVSRGRSISVIPYVIGAGQQDFEEGDPLTTRYNIGTDAKIAINSGLNLDLTINPDFSQVEVDRQVVNLSRFELFFPERRQFFLENSDLFNAFGDSRANPFFSRRIGVTQDTSTGEAISNPIYYGLRLSGKLNNDWRIGVLNMHAADEEANGLPAYNYTVAALQRKLFARSNVGIIGVNKQTFESLEGDTSNTYSTYNRVIGIDYNLASADNRWNGKAYFHLSDTPGQEGSPISEGTSIDYLERDYSFGIEQRYVGEGYNAEVGFVPRTNYFQLSLRGNLFYYPSNNKLNRHGPRFRSRMIWTPGEQNTDRIYSLSWNFNFENTSNLQFGLTNEYIYLLDEFDPSGEDATPLPGQTGYTYTRFWAEWRTDRRKKVFFNLEPVIGQFFNGYRYGLQGNLSWRYQPLGQLSINVNYNYIDLPAPYAQTGIFLIGPRIDFTFTKSLFLTGFFQYNGQLDNVNINTRLQWRFAPVSDFFLVYTDNYNTLNGEVRNRALVAKLTYWLNI